LPSEILAERDRLPVGFLETVLEYRAIARAIAAYAQDPRAEGPLVDLVKVVEFEDAQEAIDRAE